MSYRKTRTIMLAGLGIAVSVLLIAAVIDQMWLMVVGMIIMISGIIQFSIFYRCHYCGKSLTCIRGPIPECCPHCGKELK